MSAGERFSECVFDYLLANKLFNAAGEPSLGKINRKVLGDLYDRFEQSEKRKDKSERAKRLSKSDRDKLFDALALGTECDLASMTDAEGTRCGVAVAKILRVTPDVSPMEIEAACRKYKSVMSGATITPTAILNNWSKVFDSKNRRGPVHQQAELIPEPEDWRALMRDDEEDSKYTDGRPWSDVMPFYQGRIAKKCARLKLSRQ